MARASATIAARRQEPERLERAMGTEEGKRVVTKAMRWRG